MGSLYRGEAIHLLFLFLFFLFGPAQCWFRNWIGQNQGMEELWYLQAESGGVGGAARMMLEGDWIERTDSCKYELHLPVLVMAAQADRVPKDLGESSTNHTIGAVPFSPV